MLMHTLTAGPWRHWRHVCRGSSRLLHSLPDPPDESGTAQSRPTAGTPDYTNAHTLTRCIDVISVLRFLTPMRESFQPYRSGSERASSPLCTLSSLVSHSENNNWTNMTKVDELFVLTHECQPSCPSCDKQMKTTKLQTALWTFRAAVNQFSTLTSKFLSSWETIDHLTRLHLTWYWGNCWSCWKAECFHRCKAVFLQVLLGSVVLLHRPYRFSSWHPEPSAVMGALLASGNSLGMRYRS